MSKLYRYSMILDKVGPPYFHDYTGEACFLINLFHLNKGMPFTSIASFAFGGDPRRFPEMLDFINEHLYQLFYSKILGMGLSQWIPKCVHWCCYLIHRAPLDISLFETEYVNGEVVGQAWVHQHFDFETFQVFGFVDDFAMKIVRTADINATLGVCLNLQRAVYSGYKRTHGFKSHIFTLPIGIIGCVFIPEVRQNNNGMRRPSDDVSKFVNQQTSSLRQICEHVNSDHEAYFQLFNVPRYLRIYKKGPQVRKICLDYFLFQNCYYCIHGNRSRTFGQVPWRSKITYHLRLRRRSFHRRLSTLAIFGICSL